LSQAESKSQKIILEVADLRDEVSAAEEAFRLAEKAVADSAFEEANKQIEVGTINAEYEQARREFVELENLISQLSSEISGLKHEKTKISKLLESARFEAKKMSIQIERNRKDRIAAEKEVSNMVKKYSWIDSEKSAFGVVGGDYDFDESNPKHTSNILSDLKAEQESLVRIPFCQTASSDFILSPILCFPDEENKQKGNGND
jgi:structural maintenance of chromosome 2